MKEDNLCIQMMTKTSELNSYKKSNKKHHDQQKRYDAPTAVPETAQMATI